MLYEDQAKRNECLHKNQLSEEPLKFPNINKRIKSLNLIGQTQKEKMGVAVKAEPLIDEREINIPEVQKWIKECREKMGVAVKADPFIDQREIKIPEAQKWI